MRRTNENRVQKDLYIDHDAQAASSQPSGVDSAGTKAARPQSVPTQTRWPGQRWGDGMSTYGNLTFGDPLLMVEAPGLQSLRNGKPRWQCFAVSYGVQAALLASMLTVTIASPVIAPHVQSGVRLVAPYLAPEPAPKLQAYKPTVHVVPVRPVSKVLPVERKPQLIEPPIAKVEPPVRPVQPAIEAPRPQPVPKVAHVDEVPQPKAVPAPKFDSKLLNAVPGPKAEKIIATNTFGGSSAVPTLHHVDPSKVQTGGFGDPNGVPVNAHGSAHPNIAAAGSFDLPAGPGYGNGTGGASGMRGTAASAGFGNGIAVQGGGGRGGNAAQGSVKSSGFGSAVAPAATSEESRPHRAAVAATTSPVSIQSKPTPIYTAEARQLRIEGEVLLNVVFTADGHIRILNVVRGLGHGLDESAQRAAEGIRFSPATREGHAVDSTAILHIVFQLS
jgi:TonB family protein